MPTGYTAGLLDGSTKNFKEFALLCMRNFGATIHMRDDDMDKPYEPRIPSDYYTKSLKEKKDKLIKLSKTSLEDIEKEYYKGLINEKERCIKSIEKTNKNHILLEKILKEVNDFNPPTSDHLNFKNFMIEQIKSTIDFDCNPKYTVESLKNVELELKSKIDPIKILDNSIRDTIKDIKYYKKNHKEEVKRCEDSNNWVKQLYDELNKS